MSSVQEIIRVEQDNLIHSAEDIYDDGFLRVEHNNYYVACGGSPLKLPRTEFLIFSRLTRTPNRIVTADDLWSSVWGGNKPLNSESLHVYIYRLRAYVAKSVMWRSAFLANSGSKPANRTPHNFKARARAGRH